MEAGEQHEDAHDDAASHRAAAHPGDDCEGYGAVQDAGEVARVGAFESVEAATGGVETRRGMKAGHSGTPPVTKAYVHGTEASPNTSARLQVLDHRRTVASSVLSPPVDSRCMVRPGPTWRCSHERTCDSHPLVRSERLNATDDTSEYVVLSREIFA